MTVLIFFYNLGVSKLITLWKQSIEYYCFGKYWLIPILSKTQSESYQMNLGIGVKIFVW